MEKRDFLKYGLALGATALLPACSESDTSVPVVQPQPKVVVLWNQAALQAVRNVAMGPPMVSRALAIIHTAMYDAWAAYDSVALGTRLGASLRQGVSERTDANKTKAMAYAAYMACNALFPTQKSLFDTQMAALGFPLSNSVDRSKPEGVGNLAAQAVIDFRRTDGANQDGSLSASGAPYSDYTGYAPMNLPTPVSAATPLSGIAAPDRWQPLTFNNGSAVVTPSFLAAHWRQVTPFALTSAAQFRPAPPAALLSEAFKVQAQQVVDYLANLTERQKCIAEYWADGPNSETPPGHWGLFAQFVSNRDKNDNDKDVRMFFALTNAIFDAGIATWEAKRHYDYVRPVTAIRYLFNGKTIQGYGAGGPAAGVVSIQGEAWRPFQRDSFPTPPFPEYTSGHSAFSAAGAEILKSFTGSDSFAHSATIQPRSLAADPNLPVASLTLNWATYSEAAAEAGLSRLYGGIHFSDGNTAGSELGRKVAQQVWLKAKRYWEGTAS